MVQTLNQLNTANANLVTMLFGCTAYGVRINQNIFKAIHNLICKWKTVTPYSCRKHVIKKPVV